MSKNKLIVEGFLVGIEAVGTGDFISLTDIARRESTARGAKDLVASWLRNGSTLLFYET